MQLHVGKTQKMFHRRFPSFSSVLLSDRQRKRKLQESPAPDSKLLKDNVCTPAATPQLCLSTKDSSVAQTLLIFSFCPSIFTLREMAPIKWVKAAFTKFRSDYQNIIKFWLKTRWWLVSTQHQENLSLSLLPLTGRGGIGCYGLTQLGQHVLHECHSAVPQVSFCAVEEVCGW